MAKQSGMIRKAVALNEWLFRRSYSSPERRYMNPDGTAHSRVFKLRESDNGELSVDVKSMTSPSISIKDSSKFMLFEILNEDVIAIKGLQTLHDPLKDGSNNAHAVIIGLSLEDDIMPGMLARKSKRICGL